MCKYWPHQPPVCLAIFKSWIWCESVMKQGCAPCFNKNNKSHHGTASLLSPSGKKLISSQVTLLRFYCHTGTVGNVNRSRIINPTLKTNVKPSYGIKFTHCPTLGRSVTPARVLAQLTNLSLWKPCRWRSIMPWLQHASKWGEWNPRAQLVYRLRK